MAETNLYIVRHGKTMFNTLARVQGWCDTPLTQSGRDGIHYVGLGLQDTKFEEAYSSDSGRAIETMRILLSEHPDGKDIPYHVSHGLTIAFLLSLIDSKQPVRANLLNGSINRLRYENGEFSIRAINDISYMERGKTISDQIDE